jgi:hypothetical protein
MNGAAAPASPNGSRRLFTASDLGTVDIPRRALISRGELRIGLRAWWGGRQADHPCVFLGMMPEF